MATTTEFRISNSQQQAGVDGRFSDAGRCIEDVIFDTEKCFVVVVVKLARFVIAVRSLTLR